MEKLKIIPGSWKVDKEYMGPETYGDGDDIPIFPANGGVVVGYVVARNGAGMNTKKIQEMAEVTAEVVALVPELYELFYKLNRYSKEANSKMGDAARYLICNTRLGDAYREILSRLLVNDLVQVARSAEKIADEMLKPADPEGIGDIEHDRRYDDQP